MVVVEATVRLIPGVLGNEASATDESFTTGLLEHPQYTRPAVFRGWEVPEVLRGRPWPGRTLAQGGVALAHARAETRPVGGPGRS